MASFQKHLPRCRSSWRSWLNTCHRQSRAPRTTRLQPDRHRQPTARQTKHHIIMMSISIVLQLSWEMQAKRLSTTRFLVKHHPPGKPTSSNMTKSSWRLNSCWTSLLTFRLACNTRPPLKSPPNLGVFPRLQTPAVQLT
jgi:hypothetical protein